MSPSSPRLRPRRSSLALAIGALVLVAVTGCRSATKGTPPGPIRPENSMPVISVPTMAFGESQPIQLTLGSSNTVSLVAFATAYLDAKLETESQGSATIAPIAWFATKGTADGKPLLDRNATSALTHSLAVESAASQPSGTVPNDAVYVQVTLGYLDGTTATKADPDENAIWVVTIELPASAARAASP